MSCRNVLAALCCAALLSLALGQAMPLAAQQDGPAPSPAPTVFSELALPPEVRDAPFGQGRPAWEQQGLQTIALALAPIFVLLALAVLVTHLRRRN